MNVVGAWKVANLMKRERSNKFREQLVQRAARSTRGPTHPTAMREGYAEPAAEMLAALDPMDAAQG